VSSRRARSPRPVLKFSASVPKEGNGTHECDDRFSSGARRFAVADGVSEGGFSEIWAAILANAFCRPSAGDVDAKGLDAWLGRSRAEWQRWAAETSKREVPWFTREMLRRGTHATFVGLAFPARGASGAWRAVACGDSCVFVVRDDRLALSFPMSGSREFHNTPPLVPASRATRTDALRMATGTARAGDAFYLATDALAQWFLANHERGEKPWVTLDRVVASHGLDAFVAASRAAHVLKNDDVTLLSIAVEAGA